MIASYSRNFIFIKTRKTGGTSAEIVLSSWCTRHDICTPFFVDDEIIRVGYGGLPVNFGPGWRCERAYRAAIRARDKEKIARARKDLEPEILLYNHMPAAQIAAALPELWSRAFKFAVDRHPYDKAISWAYWLLWKRGYEDRRFSLLLDRVIDEGIVPNFPLYTEEGKVIVDKVVPYERMWTDIACLGERLGAELPNPLPGAKSGLRKDFRPASEILSRKQKSLIAQQCTVEFDIFGYED